MATRVVVKERSGGLLGANSLALFAGLMVSGVSLAIAAETRGFAILAWFCLIPLFAVISRWSPVRASLGGAIWGLSYLGASLTGLGPDLPNPFLSCILLPTVPAMFALFGAALTRWIGFSPFVLGTAWMFVELSLTPLGLPSGLAAVPLSDGSAIHWFAHACGYVLVAFLVAYLNAALVCAAARCRMPIQTWRGAVGAHRSICFWMSETLIACNIPIGSHSPRGPPSRCSRNGRPIKRANTLV